MKKSQKRVFAYNLAKTLDVEDLGAVAGGSGSNMTVHTTVRMSAVGPNPAPDVIYDTTTD